MSAVRLLLCASFAMLLSACPERAGLGDARAWRCTPGTGTAECTGGWECQVDGFCHDPAVGAALPCASNTDCIGGWHCGVEGECYDRSTVTDVACRADGFEGQSDCAPGWRCGLEETCHQEGVAAAYLCTNDGHCEAGWRCGVDGRCIDVANDALRPPSATLSSAVKVSPLTPGDPAHISIDSLSQQTIVYFDADKVTVLREGSGFPAKWSEASWTYSGLVRAVGLRKTVYGVTAGNQFVRFDEGSSAAQSYAFPFVPTQLTAMDGTYSGLIGWDATRVGFARFESGQPPATASYSFPTGTQIHHVASTPAGSFYASTSRGVFVARFLQQNFVHPIGNAVSPTPVFVPLGLSGVANAQCNSQGGTVRFMHIEESGSFSVLTVALDTATGVKVQQFVSSTHASAGSDCLGFGYAPTTSPCAPCEPTETFVDVTSSYSNSNGKVITDVHTYCRADRADGSTELLRRQLRSSCATSLLPKVELDAEIRPTFPLAGEYQRVGGSAGGLVSSDGHLIRKDSARLMHLHLFTAPNGFGIGKDGPIATWHSEHFDQDSAYLSTSAGLSDHQVGIIAGVKNWPGFVMRTGPAEGLQIFKEDSLEPVADLTGSPSQGAAGARAEKFDLPDGGVYMVATARDAIYGGELSGDRDGGYAGVLDVRDAPLPLGRIRSLAVAEPGPATLTPEGQPFLTGYVLSQGRVFQFRASTPLVWRSHEMTTYPAWPRAVWTDADRGRVGYEDGTVFALPSKVVIAPPIPGGVRDFTSLCGDSFALAATGLFRLEKSADQPVGEWKAVTLPSVNAPWARVFSEGQSLYLFAENGTAYRLDAETCATP